MLLQFINSMHSTCLVSSPILRGNQKQTRLRAGVVNFPFFFWCGGSQFVVWNIIIISSSSLMIQSDSLAGWLGVDTNRVANCTKPFSFLSTRCRRPRDESGRLPWFPSSSIKPGDDGRELISSREGPHREVYRLPVQRKTPAVSLDHPWSLDETGTSTIH